MLGMVCSKHPINYSNNSDYLQMQTACSELCRQVIGGMASLLDCGRKLLYSRTLPPHCPLPQLTVCYTDEETARVLFSPLVTALTLGKTGRNTWPGCPSAKPALPAGSFDPRSVLADRRPACCAEAHGSLGHRINRMEGRQGAGGGHHVWPVFLSVSSLGRLLSPRSCHTADSLVGEQPVSRDRTGCRTGRSLTGSQAFASSPVHLSRPQQGKLCDCKRLKLAPVFTFVGCHTA